MLLTSKPDDRSEHSESDSECQVCHGEVLLLLITLIETPHVCDYFLVCAYKGIGPKLPDHYSPERKV